LKATDSSGNTWTATDRLPFISREWPWFVAFFLLLGTGAFAVAFMPIARPKARVAVALTYICVIGLLLIFVSAGVSCGL
jgi:hypothetical protein